MTCMICRFENGMWRPLAGVCGTIDLTHDQNPILKISELSPRQARTFCLVIYSIYFLQQLLTFNLRIFKNTHVELSSTRS